LFDLLDVFLLAAVAAFGYSGYRQGFVIGGLAFAGFLGGGILGAKLAPAISDLFGPAGRSAPLLAILLVFLGATAGQLIAASIGTTIRRRLTWSSARVVDSVAGALMSAVSVLMVAWILAYAVDRSPYVSLAKQVRGSAVLTRVDEVVPDGVRSWFAGLVRLVDEGNFPQVFSALGGGGVAEAAPPDPAVVLTPGVRAAARSVVKVRGAAESCSRSVEGSGFVYAPDRVLTNAHVVAGVAHPVIVRSSGDLKATVVLYDPDRDVAVLAVPGLGVPSLTFNAPVGAGTSAVVAGYPQDGPYTLNAARVRDRQLARAPDIYANGTVTRDIYSLRALVRPGNSGGPLLSVDGKVLGVVFAASTDDPDTGYALTANEVASDAAAGRTADTPVSTQGCD
jgi:S1-C subfamily serine protease